MTDEEFVSALRDITPAEVARLQQSLVALHYGMLAARDGRPLEVDPNPTPEPTIRSLHEAERLRRLGPFAPYNRRPVAGE